MSSSDFITLDIRKKFFIVSKVVVVVRHWNRLPREVMDVLSLETLKVRLSGTLSTLM